MKINKVKLVVGTLAVLAVASTVGSISGTVAWWQNSYRATAELKGTSAKCTEVLEIKKFDGTWDTNLTADDIQDLITAKTASKTNQELMPVAGPGLRQTAAVAPATQLYAHPKYQSGLYANWAKADPLAYIQFDLTFRVRQVTGGADVGAAKAYNIYVNDVTIEDVTDSKTDLSRAARVHLSGNNNLLFAKGANTSDTTVTTNTHGNLDLNGDGRLDRDGKDYTFAAAGTIIDYGATAGDNQTQVAYNCLKAADGTAYPSSYANGTIAGGTVLGNVAKDDLAGDTVTVTIWLEGWQELEAHATNNSIKVTREFADETALTTAMGLDPAAVGYYGPVEGDIIKVGDAYKLRGASDFAAYTASSMWDETKTIGSVFNIGMTFDAGVAAA